MKLYYKPILFVSIIILSLLTGCIRDDHGDCVQGINIRFYFKTPCQLDTVYPEGIKDITLCIFDKNDVLIYYSQSEDVKLQKDYMQTVEIASGLYTVVAWSGLDNNLYDPSPLVSGTTKKNDLMFRLRRTAETATNIEGNKVYVGQSPAVYVSQASGSESLFERATVNLQEITNRISISVEGLDNPQNYIIDIESNNGSMNIDGSIAYDDFIDYISESVVKDRTLETTITLLKLDTSNSSTLVIKSRSDGTEVYRESLLGTLLLKNPNVNLACDHDFTIKFTAKDQCNCGTYTIMEIWVNNWLVHSYDTEM